MIARHYEEGRGELISVTLLGREHLAKHRPQRHIEHLLDKVLAWARPDDDVRAVLLVGSFARGDARPDSDIDLALLTVQPSKYLRDTAWVGAFGVPHTVTVEAYGRATSIRVVYVNGPEVEFAVTDARWAAAPLDPGTEAVARGGLVVLLDRDGEASSLAEAVRSNWRNER